jgi:peptidoglycan L-alanyl-D-glutamate endopeptidase CwlK
MSKIDTLHPLIREEVRTLVDLINTTVLKSNVKMIVTQGLRTFDEQTKLYNQKPKVTNAKAGQSLHNYGLALDFCLVDGGRTIWDTVKDFDNDKVADWMEVVKVFKVAGYVWGGDFRSIVDKPHFEKTFGHTWQQLLEIKQSGKTEDGYVII